LLVTVVTVATAALAAVATVIVVVAMASVSAAAARLASAVAARLASAVALKNAAVNRLAANQQLAVVPPLRAAPAKLLLLQTLLPLQPRLRLLAPSSFSMGGCLPWVSQVEVEIKPGLTR